MKQWLIKKLANESTYFPIFIGALCIYAALGVTLFAVTIPYSILAAKCIAMFFLFGSIVMGLIGRIVTTLCYAKLNGDKNAP